MKHLWCELMKRLRAILSREASWLAAKVPWPGWCQIGSGRSINHNDNDSNRVRMEWHLLKNVRPQTPNFCKFKATKNESILVAALHVNVVVSFSRDDDDNVVVAALALVIKRRACKLYDREGLVKRTSSKVRRPRKPDGTYLHQILRKPNPMPSCMSRCKVFQLYST